MENITITENNITENLFASNIATRVLGEVFPTSGVLDTFVKVKEMLMKPVSASFDARIFSTNVNIEVDQDSSGINSLGQWRQDRSCYDDSFMDGKRIDTLEFIPPNGVLHSDYKKLHAGLHISKKKGSLGSWYAILEMNFSNKNGGANYEELEQSWNGSSIDEHTKHNKTDITLQWYKEGPEGQWVSGGTDFYIDVPDWDPKWASAYELGLYADYAVSEGKYMNNYGKGPQPVLYISKIPID